MASIIENVLFLRKPETKVEIERKTHQYASSAQKLIRTILAQHRQRSSCVNRSSNVITTSIHYFAEGSFQSLAQINLHLNLSIVTLKIRIVRQDRVLKVDSKRKVDIFCRLFQKCNNYLSQHENIQFAINPNNGQIVVRCYLVHYLHCLSLEKIKALTEISNRMVRLVNEQMIFLFECVNQTFQSQIYSKDARYLDKIIAQSNQTLKIRDLLAVSSINFEDSSENIHSKYMRNKQFINFLSHRENMINPTIRKQHFIGNQLSLFTLFLEREYFQTHPITLNNLEDSFTKEFQTLFYKFQPKKMEEGDNPFLFNTILIKNEDKVTPIHTNASGGFSNIQIAEMEIAYTESQNSVFQSSVENVRSRSKHKQAKDQKLTYFSKQIAIKISKNDEAYEKIKHQKIIVQNFRTTASPFVLKYYNCTQRRFKYRQYLLMDYLGPNLTLSQYNQLHKMTFSMQSKMHIFIHISNALNFLEKQSVVHMDLSSNNVMVCKDFLVKVIDFGQAYHPYLDSDKTIKYLPGYTLPYCPPETFNQVKKFNHASDVFSFGIILYRTIFGDFPFNPSSSLRQNYEDKTYLNKCFIAPERLCQYGYHTQLLLLLQVIMRCLSVDEKNRPIPYWLYVMLNKIFLTFK